MNAQELRKISEEGEKFCTNLCVGNVLNAARRAADHGKFEVNYLIFDLADPIVVLIGPKGVINVVWYVNQIEKAKYINVIVVMLMMQILMQP